MAVNKAVYKDDRSSVNSPSPKVHPRRQLQKHPRRLITGKRQRQGELGMHLPQVNQLELMAMKLQEKKMMAAQDEIQLSATDLIQSSMGRLTKDEEQKNHFKREMDSSVAMPMLLKEHLDFVHQLPSPLQLAALT